VRAVDQQYHLNLQLMMMMMMMFQLFSFNHLYSFKVENQERFQGGKRWQTSIVEKLISTK
jgi:hypothetical protein